MLKAVGIHKSYPLGDTSVEVLKGLDLAIAPGELVSVMGPSGTGKTTLLNCLSGIDRADQGTVEIDGQPIDYESESVRTNLRRESIGIVFQFFNLIPTLNVTENVGLPFAIARRQGAHYRARVEEMLVRVGLTSRRSHFPHQLSGGEMQLVSIARALVHQPRLVLADEPTGNVNPETGRSVMAILRNTAKDQGASVLLVTHSPEHAAWADRVCFVKNGGIAGELDLASHSDKVLALREQLGALEI